MNVRRLQGLALILSGICLSLGLAGPPQSTLFNISALIGVILFILGIPAVYLAQPRGWIGLAGIVLLELAALIALGFRLKMISPSNLADVLFTISAISGMLGALLIGWLTIRNHVFPAWVGWVFLAQGLLNFIAGQFILGLPGRMVPFLLTVLQAVAVFAYGYFIYQMQ